MSNVSPERYYLVLHDGAPTPKISKMALNAFRDKTLHTVLHKCMQNNVSDKINVNLEFMSLRVRSRLSIRDIISAQNQLNVYRDIISAQNQLNV